MNCRLPECNVITSYRIKRTDNRKVNGVPNKVKK